MYSMFLLSYTNTHESLGELEKAGEILACHSCSYSISHSPKLLLVFVLLDRNMVHVFYFLSEIENNGRICLADVSLSDGHKKHKIEFECTQKILVSYNGEYGVHIL